MINQLFQKIIRNHYIKKGVIEEINFPLLCHQIKNCDCAFIKTKTPYTPNDFPQSIPIGKDADIVCNKKSFKKIVEIIIEWSRRLENKYRIKICEDEYCTRVRIMTKTNVLLYQVDVSWYIMGIDKQFFEDAISNRVNKGEINILEPEYEFVVRMEAYRKDKNKKYHREFLENNICDYRLEYVKKYLGYKLDDLLK